MSVHRRAGYNSFEDTLGFSVIMRQQDSQSVSERIWGHWALEDSFQRLIS